MVSTAIPGGLLVAIEGIDGAGKTTLVGRLHAELSPAGVRVVSSKEPTQGPFGQQLRDTAQTGRLSPERELDLLLADRREHVERVIGPTLQTGGIVLLDRYYYSNVAYQGAAGMDVAHLLAVNEAFAPVPDVMLLLDLDVSEGLRRISARGDYANKFEEPGSLQRAREIFLQTLPACGHRIDASASADAVFSQSLQVILRAIGAKVIAQDGLTEQGVYRMADILGGTLSATG